MSAKAGLALLAALLAGAARAAADDPLGDLIVSAAQVGAATAADFQVLPGWDQEDHAAALAAIVASCPAAREPAMLEVCARARRLGSPSEGEAKAFLESAFRPLPQGSGGLLTAYYMPVFDARPAPDQEFSAPVRPRPADLGPMAADGAWSYPDRATIEGRPAPDALAWMRPEELFFMQIQGSGVLLLPDGERVRAVFDGCNGAPFVPIAAPMRMRGLLTDTSGEAIRGWLADHRGQQADEVMRLDPRYVFFRLQPDDGQEPAGAAGVRLIPGRSLAVDPSAHAFGEPVWVEAQAPAAGAAYHRLAVALDVGGAIKGPVRADLYLGRGSLAGAAAGRVRHRLRLWRLAPRETEEAEVGGQAPGR